MAIILIVPDDLLPGRTIWVSLAAVIVTYVVARWLGREARAVVAFPVAYPEVRPVVQLSSLLLSCCGLADQELDRVPLALCRSRHPAGSARSSATRR